VLEIGSGTGGFLAVAGACFDELVGVDIAMRWLHVSRRRFRDRGLRPPVLVCACAEHLPFPDRSFDLVVSSATLEFTRDPQQVLAEASRVLTDDGLALVNTVNRFSLAPEPHVNLWGLGFLPRGWQDRYVRWRRGVGFSNIRPLSYAELKRIAAPLFSSVVVAPADVPDAVLESLPAAKGAQVRAYRLLKRLQPFAALLKWLGPEWDVALRK
jgi:SAM-dependent methyltransferase